MQRMALYPLRVLILLAISTASYSQNVFWLSGSWRGKAYFPGSDASQNYDVILKVFNVKGNKFDGVIKIIEPSDTSVHFDSKISGTVYDKYLIIKRDKILYLKNAPGIEWKISCNNCKPPRMIFSIEKGKFFFRGEENDCYKECNGITEFSKDLTEFDSLAKESVYALLNGEQKPQAIAVSFTQPNSEFNHAPSLQPAESFVAQRIIPLPAGTIALSDRNGALLLSQKLTGSLQKDLSITIKESEPIRIPVLSAGPIALSNKNTSAISLGKPPYSLLDKTPSIKIHRGEPIQIPVLPAGNIVSTKHKTSLPIYRKVSHTLQRSKPSVTIIQSTQPITKNKVISAGETIALTKKEIAKPVPHAILALPADYDDRKKNVIRTLQVNTDSVTLRVYDNGVVDGDVVSVIYNDRVVIDKLTLTARVLAIKIPVNKSGINTLVFHAYNLGEFAPNTAKLEILYGNKKEELTVASDLTVSSTIDIVHKE